MSWLIVGLGNPGPQYHQTRHNIGARALDFLKVSDELIWKKKFQGYCAKSQDFLFLRPQTFMNLSGQSVAQAANFYKTAIENILVVHDELDLPFGTVHLKKGGGLAGHNGLKSLATSLGGQEFYRFRLGIGRPPAGQDVSSWVLSPFSSQQAPWVEDFLRGCGEVLDFFLAHGPQQTATKYNRRSLIGEES